MRGIPRLRTAVASARSASKTRTAVPIVVTLACVSPNSGRAKLAMKTAIALETIVCCFNVRMKMVSWTTIAAAAASLIRFRIAKLS